LFNAKLVDLNSLILKLGFIDVLFTLGKEIDQLLNL